MHAVTGPYARELFDSVLSSSGSSGGGSCCVNATPLPDFGGGHPDPNLVYARALVDAMISDHSLCLVTLHISLSHKFFRIFPPFFLATFSGWLSVSLFVNVHCRALQATAMATAT
jgi:hypothetical protein